MFLYGVTEINRHSCEPYEKFRVRVYESGCRSDISLVFYSSANIFENCVHVCAQLCFFSLSLTNIMSMIRFYLGSFPFIFLITWLSRDSNFEGGNTAELMLRIPLIIRFSSRDFATQNNLVNKWLFSHFESEPSVSCWDDSLLCPGLVFFWCMKTCYSISRDVPFRIWSFDECQSLVCHYVMLIMSQKEL